MLTLALRAFVAGTVGKCPAGASEFSCAPMPAQPSSRQTGSVLGARMSWEGESG